MRLKLTLAYDGTGFRGWAAQPGLRTVEGVLREALAATFAEATGLAVAGRTDTGVHALANVASVDVGGGPPPERAAEALNTALPEDVAVVAGRGGAAGVPRALLRTVAQLPLPDLAEPDAVAVRGTAKLVVPASRSTCSGSRRRRRRSSAKHDFRAFTPTETQHKVLVRTVEAARWIDDGDVLAVRDHRRLVPAAHGAHARRHDGRRHRRGAAARRAAAERSRSYRPAAGRTVGVYLATSVAYDRRGCGFRSSSSISTARSSTPPRRSSAPSTTRRKRS